LISLFSRKGKYFLYSFLGLIFVLIIFSVFFHKTILPNENLKYDTIKVGIYDNPPKIFIDKVGIYFSRHGYLFTTEIDPIDPKTREKFIDWLKDKGDELYGWRNQRKEN